MMALRQTGRVYGKASALESKSMSPSRRKSFDTLLKEENDTDDDDFKNTASASTPQKLMDRSKSKKSQKMPSPSILKFTVPFKDCAVREDTPQRIASPLSHPSKRPRLEGPSESRPLDAPRSNDAAQQLDEISQCISAKSTPAAPGALDLSFLETSTAVDPVDSSSAEDVVIDTGKFLGGPPGSAMKAHTSREPTTNAAAAAQHSSGGFKTPWKPQVGAKAAGKTQRQGLAAQGTAGVVSVSAGRRSVPPPISTARTSGMQKHDAQPRSAVDAATQRATNGTATLRGVPRRVHPPTSRPIPARGNTSGGPAAGIGPGTVASRQASPHKAVERTSGGSHTKTATTTSAATSTSCASTTSAAAPTFDLSFLERPRGGDGSPRAGGSSILAPIDDDDVVVNGVCEAHSIREAGRFQLIADDVAYLLDGMQCARPCAMRVSSMLKLAKKVLTEEDFRAYLRAHSVIRRVLACVQDAPTVPALGIPACAMLLALHVHARRAADGAVGVVPLLVRLLAGARAAAAATATQGSPGRAGGGAASAAVRRKLLLQRRQETKAKDVVFRTLQLAQPALMFPFASPAAVTLQALALECLSMVLRVMDAATLAAAHAELRVLGGLDTLVDTVHGAVQVCVPAAETSTAAVRTTLPTVALVSRSLRAVLGAIRQNESNRMYVSCLFDHRLLHTLCRFVPAMATTLSAATQPAVDEMCIAISHALNALLGLTHENTQGCVAFGGHPAALAAVARLALGAVPLPSAHQHDIGAMSLTLLINVTEDNRKNRHAVTDVQLSSDVTTAPSPLVETLTAVVVSKCTTMRDTGKEAWSSQDQTLDNVVGAYAAILMGCLCRDNAVRTMVCHVCVSCAGFWSPTPVPREGQLSYAVVRTRCVCVCMFLYLSFCPSLVSLQVFVCHSLPNVSVGASVG
eukprot:m.430487 g.430487  ORF g.430487 m.430487 type:complete len:916 (+) comp21395_c0_seq2:298-3045(+)